MIGNLCFLINWAETKLKVLSLSLSNIDETILLLRITEVAIQQWSIIGRWNHSSFKCFSHFALKTESGASLDKASKVWTSKSNLSMKIVMSRPLFVCLMLSPLSYETWGSEDWEAGFVTFFLDFFFLAPPPLSSSLSVAQCLTQCERSCKNTAACDGPFLSHTYMKAETYAGTSGPAFHGRRKWDK